MTVTVTWPMRLKNTLNAREHWAVKAKRVKAERNATRLMLKTTRLATAIGRHGYGDWETGNGRLAVRLARIYAGKCQPMDDDGLSAAFKGVRDSVAEYLGLDDADPRIRFECAQARGPANMVRIDFAVESDVRTKVAMNAAATERTIAAALEAHNVRG